MHEAKEVLWIKLPADKNATLPLYPGEEGFDQPTPGISPKPTSILRGALAAIGSCGATISMPSSRNWSSGVTIIGADANEGLGLGFNHVKVKAQLGQAHFMMICGVRTRRRRQVMAIHYRHDFHAFSTLGALFETYCRPASLFLALKAAKRLMMAGNAKALADGAG